MRKLPCVPSDNISSHVCRMVHYLRKGTRQQARLMKEKGGKISYFKTHEWPIRNITFPILNQKMMEYYYEGTERQNTNKGDRQKKTTFPDAVRDVPAL